MAASAIAGALIQHGFLIGEVKATDTFAVRVFGPSAVCAPNANYGVMADLLFNQVANPIIASFTLTGVSLTYDSAAKKTKFTSNSIDIASIGTASTAAFVRYAYCFRVGGTVLVDPIAFMLDLDAALAATVGITLYGDRLISAPGNNGWLRFGQ